LGSAISWPGWARPDSSWPASAGRRNITQADAADTTPLAAHASEPSRSTAMAAMKVDRAPKRSATQPLIGMNTANDSR